MKIKRKMKIFKGKPVGLWMVFSLQLMLLLIGNEAVERKVNCKPSTPDAQYPHINDVYHEFDTENCDGNVSETANEYRSDSAPTDQTRLSHDALSTRKPRSENTDAIVPTSVLQFDPRHSPTATAELRQNNPNADIQDIITGIVKLLNGNVNVHANTQFPLPSTRRIATRINNRGPPRISEMPIILPGIEEKYAPKTTPYPTGVRKPPTIPYPFDLPPEKPLRNEHPIMMHKPPPQLNRPPWHGSRTRPPIQISKTNRPQMPTRVNLPPQPTQELRPPSKSVTSTQVPDVTNPADVYDNSEQPIKANQPDQTLKETLKKPDKKSTRVPSSSVTESSKEVPEMPSTISPSAATIQQTTEIPTMQTTIAEMSSKTPDLEPSIEKTPITLEINTTEAIHTQTTISPSKVSQPSQKIESTDFKSFYARPGIVLDDTDFKPGALEPSTQPHFHNIHRTPGVQSSASLSKIYAEIFDVTLSAIQGQPHHNKVVDLIEIANTEPGATDIVATKLYGHDGNDIIVTASDDNSFVSIDGKRTYINLFGETAETEHLKKPLKTQADQRIYQQASKTVTPYAEKTNSIPSNRGKPSPANKPIANRTASPQLPLSMRYNYRTRLQQNAVRIDTCIVGDDSTCDTAQNEMCKTDLGVSSCHCRPGYARRKYRDPCRRVVSLLMSMRIDKYYEKPIVWDKVYADSSSEQFEHMSYETMRAVDSVMSMTPFSDDFISARVHNFYTGNASQGSPGVYVNITIQLDGNTESARSYIQSDLQKQLIAVIHRRNNNIGNSALYVDQPAGSISSLQDLDECSSPELNDCHESANCTNSWGAFYCKCAAGLRDPWSDQMQRAGRECISCSNSYCNNRGTCQYDETGTQLVCVCVNSFYGSQCEIDGDILAVSVGASIIAVLIISLTLVCLVMWGRRWNQEQKEMIGSPIFNYITRANLDTHMKTMQSKTYQAALEDRMRWAQIADVMAQSNHYAVEPVASQRVQPPMFVYQNMHHPNNSANLPSLSMAGTLPVRRGMSELSIPVSRMAMETTSKMRRPENTSSSEEDDLVDLLGSTYQSPTGIYYDVDCESSDQQHATSTLQSNLDNGGPLYSLSNASTAPRVPMTTYTPNPRIYPRN